MDTDSTPEWLSAWNRFRLYFGILLSALASISMVLVSVLFPEARRISIPASVVLLVVLYLHLRRLNQTHSER